MKTAREYAIEWLYPGVIPNPAQLRRDEQVDMLTKRFERAMGEAKAEGFEEGIEASANVVQSWEGKAAAAGLRKEVRNGTEVYVGPPATVKAGDLMWSPGTGKVAVVPSPYGAYSTVDGDLVRVDPTNGKITITLPLALPVTFRTLEAVKAWMALSDGQRDCYYTNAKRPLLGGSAYDGCEIAEVVLRELAVDEGAK